MRFKAAGAAQPFATLLGCLQADLRSFRDQRRLELGNRAEHVEHQFACWCACVDAVRDGAETHAPTVQIVQDGREVLDRAPEAIQLPHHQRIAGLKQGQRLIQRWPPVFPSGDLLFKDPCAAISAKLIALCVKALVFRGDAGISNLHAVPRPFVRRAATHGACRAVVLVCVPQRNVFGTCRGDAGMRRIPLGGLDS